MGAPTQIDPQSPGDYLEVMSMMVFQSGMSWKVVQAKWPGIREAFRGFDAATVADMTEADIDRLAADARVIRNRRKLAAIVENANAILDLDARHGSFRAYLRAHGDFETTVKALRQDFKFLGDTGCHMFLHVVGEETPPCEKWAHSRGARERAADQLLSRTQHAPRLTAPRTVWSRVRPSQFQPPLPLKYTFGHMSRPGVDWQDHGLGPPRRPEQPAVWRDDGVALAQVEGRP